MNVKELLQEAGVTPSKRMGQSFLVSKKIANHIISACEIKLDDVILEVGAGLGILTELLCVYGARVFAIEKDPTLFDFLTQKFKTMNNLTLLNQDILSLELSMSLLRRYTPRKDRGSAPCKDAISKLKIVANLPYSITSDFLYWLLHNWRHIDSCILTLQKEVVQRICASPGNKIYGSISVLLQFYMQIKPLFLIPGTAFFPRSKVVSQVIALKPKSQIPAINEGLFFRIVHTAFAERRKKLKNSLKLKEDTISEAMTSCGIDLSRRPETLGYEEFVHLSRVLQK